MIYVQYFMTQLSSGVEVKWTGEIPSLNYVLILLDLVTISRIRWN
jgi:hypothetical protein